MLAVGVPVLYAVALALQCIWPLEQPTRFDRARIALLVLVSALVLGSFWGAARPVALDSNPLTSSVAGAGALASVVLAGFIADTRIERPTGQVLLDATIPALAAYVLVMVPVRIAGEPTPHLWWTIALFLLIGAHVYLRKVVNHRFRRRGAAAHALKGRKLGLRYIVRRVHVDAADRTTTACFDRRDKRQVVVKLIMREGPTGALAIDEIASLARLKHPNIVPLLDHWVDDTRVALVFAHAPGGDLAARLDADALTRSEWQHVARGLLAGLQAAHDAGVVHCDIKPANLLVNGNGDIWIADFGLARIPDADATLLQDAGGPPQGTLHYMAPEVARTGQYSPLSDLWSAAATLYALGTGQTVHGKMDHLSAPEALVRVSSFAEGSVVAPADSRMAQVMSALAPSPSARPRSARALAKRLAL